MNRLVAPNLVLRLVFAGMMDVAFIAHVLGVHADDFAAHPTGLRVPAHVIANLEYLCHGGSIIPFRYLARTV